MLKIDDIKSNEQLFTLKNLSTQEALEAELLKVLDNIEDPATDPTKARSITLKWTLQPTVDRQAFGMTVEASSKLAPKTFLQVQMHMSEVGDNIIPHPDVDEDGVVKGQTSIFEEEDSK